MRKTVLVTYFKKLFTGFQQKVVEILINIRQQNQDILALLKSERKRLIPEGALIPDDVPVTFPLQTFDEIETLESYLESSDKQTLLVLNFSNIIDYLFILIFVIFLELLCSFFGRK